MAANTPPPVLDPPFRGYIETTFDALLVFEAARRGMIPRVTRRLIERERGMVQSGAVFVFDEHESGIKRWTDGLVWSPSRILGNFLVYRETDKRPTNNPATPMTNSGPASTSPQQNSPASLPSGMQPPGYDSVLGHGALPRPRSGSDGGAGLDRQRERQLVGSLTNSYKFKENGLVKKTMSVTVNGFAQDMISYYSVEDVLHGRLRAPSTIPELAGLEISAEYLHKQNFRFPPMIEVGPDGVPRYRGEPEEPQSPTSPLHAGSGFGTEYDAYGQPRQRSHTVPMPIPVPPSSTSAHSYIPAGPSSASSAYFDQSQMASPPPLMRQASNSSMTSATGALRPGSSSRRYDPYNQSSPRSSIHSRRQSQPVVPVPADYYAQSAGMDIKPNIVSPTMGHAPNPYHYQPPATAPSSFSDFGAYPPPLQPTSAHYAPQYSTWHPAPPGRFQQQHPREFAPPSSSGSSGSAGHPVQHQPVPAPAPVENGAWNQGIIAPPHSAGGWDPGYAVQDPAAEWRGAQGTQVG